MKDFFHKVLIYNFQDNNFLVYAFCSFLYQDIIVKIRFFKQKSHCKVWDIYLRALAKEDAEAPHMIWVISIAFSHLPDINEKEHIAEYSTHLRCGTQKNQAGMEQEAFRFLTYIHSSRRCCATG